MLPPTTAPRLIPTDVYRALLARHPDDALGNHLRALLPLLTQRLVEKPHGDFDRWLLALNTLPPVVADHAALATSHVGASRQKPLSDEEHLALERGLRGLMPWRKGPFNLFGVTIDTEWRSDLKWRRLQQFITPLTGRRVLDVGCGSGYHCWRMLGDGAREVIGIDPSLLFLFQFLALKRYLGEHLPVDYLPIKSEEWVGIREQFDTVFSMGVLYHRKSPIEHLDELCQFLRPGGELVLETLVIDGPEGYSLVPVDRYSMMRNVWFIPTTATIERWLSRTGFTGIRTVDVSVTGADEQRQTDWMRFQSLGDFLDPDDPSRTIEGYPAPRRAVILARKR